MPVLLDACGSSHADLRQCAVYGVGLGASLAPDAFKPHAAAALAAVQAIVTAPVGVVVNVHAGRGEGSTSRCISVFSTGAATSVEAIIMPAVRPGCSLLKLSVMEGAH
jgi:hypothetical protein